MKCIQSQEMPLESQELVKGSGVQDFPGKGTTVCKSLVESQFSKRGRVLVRKCLETDRSHILHVLVFSHNTFLKLSKDLGLGTNIIRSKIQEDYSDINTFNSHSGITQIIDELKARDLRQEMSQDIMTEKQIKCKLDQVLLYRFRGGFCYVLREAFVHNLL